MEIKRGKPKQKSSPQRGEDLGEGADKADKLDKGTRHEKTYCWKLEDERGFGRGQCFDNLYRTKN